MLLLSLHIPSDPSHHSSIRIQLLDHLSCHQFLMWKGKFCRKILNGWKKFKDFFHRSLFPLDLLPLSPPCSPTAFSDCGYKRKSFRHFSRLVKIYILPFPLICTLICLLVGAYTCACLWEGSWCVMEREREKAVEKCLKFIEVWSRVEEDKLRNISSNQALFTRTIQLEGRPTTLV